MSDESPRELNGELVIVVTAIKVLPAGTKVDEVDLQGIVDETFGEEDGWYNVEAMLAAPIADITGAENEMAAFEALFAEDGDE